MVLQTQAQRREEGEHSQEGASAVDGKSKRRKKEKPGSAVTAPTPAKDRENQWKNEAPKNGQDQWKKPGSDDRRRLPQKDDLKKGDLKKAKEEGHWRWVKNDPSAHDDFLEGISNSARRKAPPNVTTGTPDGEGERAWTSEEQALLIAQGVLNSAVEEGTTLAGLRLTNAVVIQLPSGPLSVTCRASGGPSVDRSALAQSLALLLHAPIYALSVFPGPASSFGLSFTLGGEPPSGECGGSGSDDWSTGDVVLSILIPIVCFGGCSLVMIADKMKEKEHAAEAERGRRMSEVRTDTPPPAAQVTPEPQREGEELAVGSPKLAGPTSHLSV